MSFFAILTWHGDRPYGQGAVVVILFAVRSLLVVVFGAAAAAKLQTRSEFRSFANSLALSGFVRDAGAVPLALLIVALELSSAALLLPGQTVGVGLALSVLTVALLTIGVVGVVLSKREVQCRCFGADGEVLSVRHLIRNVVLLLVSVAAFAIWLARHTGGLFEAPEIAAVAVGVLGGVLLTRWDDLAFLVVGDIRPKRIFQQEV